MWFRGGLISFMAVSLWAATPPHPPRTAPANAPAPAATSALHQRIEKILQDLPPGLQRAHWGIAVKNLRTGRLLYVKNEDQLFTPASNVKLFTTALALTRLGPLYRFQTSIWADTTPDETGTVQGDLRLIGGGDPTLSGRMYPYTPDDSPVTTLRVIEEFADQIVAKGIRAIEGSIVGDDTAYTWSPYPAGWSSDDEMYEYGAPVSALTIHDNIFRIRIRPGTPGSLARVNLNPELAPYLIQNHLRTAGTERHISIERPPNSHELILYGTIPPGDEEFDQFLAIDDPALYAAQTLQEALARRGVRIGGAPRAEHRYNYEDATPREYAGVELCRRTSPPMWQILQTLTKISQNLHAEMVLREVGLQTQKSGTRRAALKEMTKFLGQASISADDFLLEDGSGLARIDMVSPLAIVKLLAYMDHSKNSAYWHGFLPVAGQDGTLSKRFPDLPANLNIHAKTGTLSRVIALSGYARKDPADPVAFTILLNNYTVLPADARDAVDKIAVALLE